MKNKLIITTVIASFIVMLVPVLGYVCLSKYITMDSSSIMSFYGSYSGAVMSMFAAFAVAFIAYAQNYKIQEDSKKESLVKEVSSYVAEYLISVSEYFYSSYTEKYDKDRKKALESMFLLRLMLNRISNGEELMKCIDEMYNYHCHVFINDIAEVRLRKKEIFEAKYKQIQDITEKILKEYLAK